jgi:serine/threonine-protein kinase
MTDELHFGTTIIRLQSGDIVQAGTEALVNAANSSLAGGSGVDGAIHHAAGPELYIQTRQFGGCPTGSAVITTAGHIPLPTRYIIHAVGPIFNPLKADKSSTLLASAYRKSLELAEEKQLKSIAFPAISTGAYMFPRDKAAPIALQTTLEFLKAQNPPSSLELVLFVLFSAKDLEVYRQALSQL